MDAKENALNKPYKSKPLIECAIAEYLDTDMKDSVLSFVEYLRENKLPPTWASSNSWKISFKGKGVCYVKISTERWHIQPIGHFGDNNLTFVTNDLLKEIVWSCVKICNACNGRYIGKKRPCNFGVDRTIFGKDFNNVCHYLIIKNPNDDMLGFVKMWIETKKNEILGNLVKLL